VKHINVEGASCLGDRRVKYFRNCVVEYIGILGASCSGIG
jgi:hypothetical protein